MTGIKIETTVEEPVAPASRMRAVASVATILSSHVETDGADTMMTLIWAALHVAVKNGVPLDQARNAILSAVPHAERCERAAQSRNWGPLI